VPKEEARDESRQHLAEILSDARIEATPITVVAENNDEAIVRMSADSAVVIRGFDPAEEGRERLFSAAHQSLMNELATVILVHSAGDVDVSA
jgi:hypothetical protein